MNASPYMFRPEDAEEVFHRGIVEATPNPEAAATIGRQRKTTLFASVLYKPLESIGCVLHGSLNERAALIPPPLRGGYNVIFDNLKALQGRLPADLLKLFYLPLAEPGDS